MPIDDEAGQSSRLMVNRLQCQWTSDDSGGLTMKLVSRGELHTVQCDGLIHWRVSAFGVSKDRKCDCKDADKVGS